MKTKLLFMLIGALLMLASLKLVAWLSKPNSQVSSTIIGAKATSSNSSANEFCANVESAQEPGKRQPALPSKSPEDPPECLPSEISYAEIMAKMTEAMFNDTQYSDAISQMELAILGKQLRSIESIDDARVTQIKAIAKRKIDTDLKLSNELNTDPYILNSMTSLSINESTFNSQKNQELLNEFNKKSDQVALQREQTRIEYEDNLRNILSYEELNQYQKNESAVAQRSMLSEVEHTHKTLSDDYIKLSANQKKQLDNLLQEAQRQASLLVPIGSTLGNSDGLHDMSLEGLSDDDVYTKMFMLLTPEQEQLYEEYSFSSDYDEEYDY